MATASGNLAGMRKPVMPVAAYGVVLTLLVVAGVIVFMAGSGSGLNTGESAADIASRPGAVPTLADMSAARGLKLPPRLPPPEKAGPETPPPGKLPLDKPPVDTAAAPVRPEPLPVPIAAPAPPPQAEAEVEKKPEPSKTACKVDLTRWPTDKSDQAQAIQMLLRDLGYYRGTTNGTVGPQTRTAIREFQLAAGEGETGEIGEALFEALKKKCAATP